MHIAALVDGKTVRLECGPRLKIDGRLSVPSELVLDCTVEGAVLTIKALAPHGGIFSCMLRDKTRKVTDEQWRNRTGCSLLKSLELVTVRAHVAQDDAAAAAAFRDTLLKHAYPGGQRRRRILVVCNPIGGRGQGSEQLESHVVPLLEAAGCTVDVRKTERRLHARDIGLELDVSRFDAAICVGGDGTMHELVNGIASREDAVEALRLPLVPVPCGSGNGLYVSLFGVAPGFSVPLACLAAVKGRDKPHEMCVVTQPKALFREWDSMIYRTMGTGANGQEYVQYYSFLSQAIGLMADIDLGTEDWRFIGDLRFSIGYVFGAVRNLPCLIDIDVYIGDAGSVDLQQMSTAPRGGGPIGHPQLRHGSVVDEIERATDLDLDSPHPVPNAWQRVAVQTSSLYAGKLPFVARTLMAFPYASSGDGAVDVVIQKSDSSVIGKLGAVAAGEDGKHIFDPTIRYFKAEAVRITPNMSHKGSHYLSVDGEMVPYGPIQVEACPLCVHLLTLDDDASGGIGTYARPEPRGG
ncbi:sphingosine kinase [Malassezia cuniculi]|uniref:Sphingosine kinase n=1 Tax=Malassezia cuniculi TaxID=948313 RepID=A0AAF0EYA9_9BASI|nr:sphingosine kinase [Malassezia cuniculi]